MDRNKEPLLLEGERLDDLQRCGYYLIQHPDSFCFGIDAVLLSSFAEVRPGETALDLCSGTGAVPILLAGKTRGEHFSGIEIQKASADRAKRSVLYNGLSDRVRIVEGDIKEAEQWFAPASFHVITCNPPYLKGDGGLHGENDEQTIARHEVMCTLDDVLNTAARLLVPGGRFYLVHRPFRLADIICGMREKGLEPKKMRLVQPFAGQDPNLVLIMGVRGGRPQLNVDNPLVVWEKPGVYTKETLAFYGGEYHDETDGQ